MIRLALICAALCSAACTLLLATDRIITPCTSEADCGEGFFCEENACLPEGTDDSSG